MPRINFDENIVSSTTVEEDIRGIEEFNFWSIISGLFGDIDELSERINRATEAVYAD